MSAELNDKRLAAVYRQPSAASAPKVSAGFGQYPPIIALSGKRGAGKDSTADIITSLTRGSVEWGRLSFAGPLKDCAAIITGVDRGLFDTQEGKAMLLEAFGITGGEFLQNTGVGLRDILGPDVWVHAAMSKVKPGRHYLITDVRFPNEAEAIQRAGGVVIRIEGDPLGQRGDGTRNDNHPSETALDDVWLPTISNRGSLHSLRAKVANLMQHLGNGVTPTVESAKHWMAFK